VREVNSRNVVACGRCGVKLVAGFWYLPTLTLFCLSPLLVASRYAERPGASLLSVIGVYLAGVAAVLLLFPLVAWLCVPWRLAVGGKEAARMSGASVMDEL
jgi:hypothetical protein